MSKSIKSPVSPEERKKIVEKAKHYYSLVGADFTSMANISAMAIAIGWSKGKLDSRKNNTQSGVLISDESHRMATMIACAHSLAMEFETMEEAFLDEENEEAA